MRLVGFTLGLVCLAPLTAQAQSPPPSESSAARPVPPNVVIDLRKVPNGTPPGSANPPPQAPVSTPLNPASRTPQGPTAVSPETRAPNAMPPNVVIDVRKTAGATSPIGAASAVPSLPVISPNTTSPLAPPRKLPPELLQGPEDNSRAASNPAAPALPSIQPFDTGSLRIKRESDRWQLWAGMLLLKDFGKSEEEAYQALQVFRDLRVNARGSVGGVFEYWLCDQEAPSGMTRHRQVILFDNDRLRVDQQNGHWVLRDDQRILYNFASAREEAEQALAVCKHYGFNQLGFIGHPQPTMKYLMRDANQRRLSAGRDAIVPVSARMTAAEQPRGRLIVPSLGDLGDRLPIETRRMELRRQNTEWILDMGKQVFARFGVNEREARLAYEAYVTFRVTELCRIGESAFSFYLSHGRAPQGTLVGYPSRPFNTDRMTVRPNGTRWAIFEGSQPFLEIGASEADAQKALAAIRHFRFDTLIHLNAGKVGPGYLFVKTKP